jgi:hypothetical protein
VRREWPDSAPASHLELACVGEWPDSGPASHLELACGGGECPDPGSFYKVASNGFQSSDRSGMGSTVLATSTVLLDSIASSIETRMSST